MPTAKNSSAPLPQWWCDFACTGQMPELDEYELAEIATERNPTGPQATIRGIFDALHVRHRADKVTVALLSALEHYHLPDLLDLVQDGKP